MKYITIERLRIIAMMMMKSNHLIGVLSAMMLAALVMAPLGGLSGAPTNKCPQSDHDLWIEREFSIVETNLQECGLSSLGQETAAFNCLRGKSQLSDTCIKCQVDLIVCTGKYCAIPCANGGRSNPKCKKCVEEQSMCNSNFLQCTGFDFPK